jgi:hypothetical protein
LIKPNKSSKRTALLNDPGHLLFDVPLKAIGAPFWLNERNVVLGNVTSLSVTLVAGSGPMFVT